MLGSAARVERAEETPAAAIYYQVAGDGPPVVLVHGLSGSGRWWARNVDALATRYRVFVVDLLGFGGSRGAHPFLLRDAATHLAAWLEQLGVERASIVGHSMGGFIAADLAARYPTQVERLVLVDAVALPPDPRPLRHALGLGRALCRLPASFLPVLVADACRAGPRTIGTAARELLTMQDYPPLDRIEASTLVVWGEHDKLVPLELGRQLCERLPGAQLAVIPRAGHNPMWDRPTEFNHLVGAFLAGEPAVARSLRVASGQPSGTGRQASVGSRRPSASTAG
jgi:pimeloyl-ACP methyl ester carboxylesterase